jgi:hypothetical protein
LLSVESVPPEPDRIENEGDITIRVSVDPMRTDHVLRNAMEHEVSRVLDRYKSSAAAFGSPCWCSSCEADIMALALSSLPPRYHTNPAPGRVTLKASELYDSVAGAARTVALRPKAHCFEEERGQRLVNISLEEASMIMANLVGETALFCECEACRNAILAYTLNRIAPKYGVQRSGRLPLPSFERQRLRREIALMIALAAGIVASTPPSSCAGSFS